MRTRITTTPPQTPRVIPSDRVITTIFFVDDRREARRAAGHVFCTADGRLGDEAHVADELAAPLRDRVAVAYGIHRFIRSTSWHQLTFAKAVLLGTERLFTPAACLRTI